jgi:hypothetical protein
MVSRLRARIHLGDSSATTEPFLTLLGVGLGIVPLVVVFSMVWDQEKHKPRKN